MSRSIKHTPHAGCEKTKKPGKQRANRKLRRKLNRPINYGVVCDNNAYRKHTEKWDICDYESRCTFDEYVACRKWVCSYTEEYIAEHRDELYREWFKYYKMK